MLLEDVDEARTEVESLFEHNLTALEAVDSIVAEIFQVMLIRPRPLRLTHVRKAIAGTRITKTIENLAAIFSLGRFIDFLSGGRLSGSVST